MTGKNTVPAYSELPPTYIRVLQMWLAVLMTESEQQWTKLMTARTSLQRREIITQRVTCALSANIPTIASPLPFLTPSVTDPDIYTSEILARLD
jgi:hypothetical protein